ncbi:DEAD/DEAH box helicase family protein [Neorhizobium sp. BT27B]|uniref:DEAD/DEAH box helicase n=1 Tax=Neorhizobium sp. BT27B TaxID=3142625 RepID=UPI003D2B5D42
MGLRYYQEEAVEALFDYWGEEAGNPLIDLATGTGKSMVMATVIRQLVEGWPDMRIMVVTHVAELIEQNFLELLGVWKQAPAGIFSAGLNRRDARSQIIFAGIQTVWNKADLICGARLVDGEKVYDRPIDVVLVDECHLIPKNSDTQYGQFFRMMREVNPDLKIVGLTATPFRLDSGRLDEGEDRMFDRVVYTYGIADGVRDGYLAPLSSKHTATELSMKGVGRLGADYKQSAMQAAVDKPDVTQAAVDEIVAKGADKRSWLCFCSGVEHAEHVRDEIRSRGISCEMITGDTPKEERRRIIEDFKAYRIRALTNNSVLTTGFNHKGVDLIAALRPTLSASLYLQMMGRGTRVLYAPGMALDTPDERRAAIAAGPKPSCLVLDFAGLVDKHGPVDMVEPKEPGSGDGEAPMKICPQDGFDKNGSPGCGEKLHASARICSCCGFEFDIDDSPKIAATAADVPIMTMAEPESRTVTSRTFRFHEGKGDKPPSVKITFMSGMTAINEWVCPQHSGFAKTKADRFWLAHGGNRPFPREVMEWLERQSELKETAVITVQPRGKYWDVVEHAAGENYAANDNDEPPANDNRPRPAWMDEEDIPF